MNENELIVFDELEPKIAPSAYWDTTEELDL